MRIRCWNSVAGKFGRNGRTNFGVVLERRAPVSIAVRGLTWQVTTKDKRLEQWGALFIVAIMKPKAKFFTAKIAFEIPTEYQVKSRFGATVPEKLVEKLMDLFDFTEFVPEDICTPPLLIVNWDDVPTSESIKNAETRINQVLKKQK